VAVSTMNNPITAGPWVMRHDLVGGLMIERRWGNAWTVWACSFGHPSLK